jgi:hypothetical protein
MGHNLLTTPAGAPGTHPAQSGRVRNRHKPFCNNSCAPCDTDTQKTGTCARPRFCHSIGVSCGPVCIFFLPHVRARASHRPVRFPGGLQCVHMFNRNTQDLFKLCASTKLARMPISSKQRRRHFAVLSSLSTRKSCRPRHEGCFKPCIHSDNSSTHVYSCVFTSIVDGQASGHRKLTTGH